MKDVVDPIAFCHKFWPHIKLYKQQREILYSLRDNDETYSVAGNMLGKDFIAGLAVLWFFMSRHPCRIVTTSTKDDHLRVLWGEIHNFINTAKSPLDVSRGGTLIVNQRELRRVIKGQKVGLSYVIGMVASQDKMAAFQGHHIARTGDGIPRTLFVGDEASGLLDEYYTMASTWANRMLIIGNPWPCNNFFRYAVEGRPGSEDKGGNLKSPTNNHYYRKIIKIKAEDSPNVRLGLAQKKRGEVPTDEIIIPGVKSYSEYVKNREMWDSVQQCVSLDAEFYKGADVLMFPPEWLNLAEQRARAIGTNRKAKTVGVDPAEGGDSTVMAAVDELGLIALISKKTPDTSVIPFEVIAFAQQHGVEPRNVYFDAGGGGKQHADKMRREGYNVKTVRFGETASPDLRWGRRVPLKTRQEEQETQYTYVNRRAEMYHLLRLRLDPSEGEVFAIPADQVELRRQLAPIPLTFTEEGRIWLPPKRKPPQRTGKESTVRTITEMLGCSPDEADAVVLAVFGLSDRKVRRNVGVGF